MPLLAPTVTTPPVEEPPPRPIPPRPPAPVALWTPNGGDSVQLTCGPVVSLQRGVHGLDMPPEEQYRTAFPGDGTLFQGRRAAAGEVMLPVMVRGTGLTDLETKRRELMGLFNPRRGSGVLTWELPEGNPRSITLLYESGLNSPINGHRGAGINHHEYQIVLIADDPYWYGNERTVSFKPSETATQPFLPGPPFHIAGPGPGGTRNVTIDGEVDTNPTLRMVGPMSTATWVHEDLDITLELTPNLLAGQELVVRTGPGVIAQQRFLRDGVNAWGEVAGDFPPLVPWVLRPGMNAISTQFTGTGSGSDAFLTYKTRYLSA